MQDTHQDSLDTLQVFPGIQDILDIPRDCLPTLPMDCLVTPVILPTVVSLVTLEAVFLLKRSPSIINF